MGWKRYESLDLRKNGNEVAKIANSVVELDEKRPGRGRRSMMSGSILLSVGQKTVQLAIDFAVRVKLANETAEFVKLD